MTRYIQLILILIMGLSLGFWIGRHKESQLKVDSTSVSERKPLYYRHPMNPQVTSTTPAKDEMGMDYVAVYAEAASFNRDIAKIRQNSVLPASDGSSGHFARAEKG